MSKILELAQNLDEGNFSLRDIYQAAEFLRRGDAYTRAVIAERDQLLEQNAALVADFRVYQDDNDALRKELAELRLEFAAYIGQEIDAEPIGWINKREGHFQGNHQYISKAEAEQYSTNGQWTPLYTYPPKREPCQNTDLINQALGTEPTRASLRHDQSEPHAWLHSEHQGWVVRMPPPDTGEGRWYPVYTAAPEQPKVELSSNDKTWCQYIAGMIGAYLGEPVDSDKCNAIAGIIERRLWALPQPKSDLVQEPVAWRLLNRLYASKGEAEFDWRNDPVFDNTGYCPEPLYAAPDGLRKAAQMALEAMDEHGNAFLGHLAEWSAAVETLREELS